MKNLTFLMFFLFSVSLFAQKGKEFPFMEAETLSRQLINLPEATTGKYTLIALAFSKKAEEDLNTWFQPAYNQFIHKPEKPSLFDKSYDVHVYFIPMFTGVKRPAYEKVMENVAKDIDKRLYPHVLFYKGQLKEYKDYLDFDGREIPYFYILDKEGKIVYTTSGKYTQSKMQEIVNLLEDADL